MEYELISENPVVSDTIVQVGCESLRQTIPLATIVSRRLYSGRIAA